MTITADVKILLGSDTITLSCVDKNETINKIRKRMGNGQSLHVDIPHMEAIIGPDALRSSVVIVENIQGTDDDTNT